MGLGDFALHKIPLGGGCLAIAPAPGANGDFATDISQIAEWGARLVITMTTVDELQALGTANMRTDLVQMGIDWLHLPVPDFSTPDTLDWSTLRENVLGRLENAEHVLVHCRGGCGRSGMLALRLMIAGGEAPNNALKRLRSIRPCAVETADQMRWAMQDAG
ncbi:phosphatase domain-containing protein [Loktanella sp. S4079]|uniref:phosphatase domain-containing protein n=1 Tax=Loktanella sp. S4079 TaxID=579483 RepID=UPI0005F9F2FE|nr:protein-tyrosine phosphatase family protein [Loktanella sp. S4079]